MRNIRMVVLTKSSKYGNNCVAGIDFISCRCSFMLYEMCMVTVESQPEPLIEHSGKRPGQP